MGSQGDDASLSGLLQRLDTLNERLKSPRDSANAAIHVHNDGIMRSAGSALGLAAIVSLILFAIWAVPAIRDADAWLRVHAEKIQKQQAEIESLKKELAK